MNRPPEDYYWLWAIKGFQGLIDLVQKPMELGYKPPPEAVTQLQAAYERIGKLLKQLA